MIIEPTAWILTDTPLDEGLVRVPLPEPHVGEYQDYEDAPPVGETDRFGQVSMGGRARVLVGGGVLGQIILDHTGEVVLLDWLEVPAGWQGCDPAPATQWQTCE